MAAKSSEYTQGSDFYRSLREAAYRTTDLDWTSRSEGIKFGFLSRYTCYKERINSLGWQLIQARSSSSQDTT